MFCLTDEELDAMASVDVRTVDINTLTDLRDIVIDTKLPVAKKLELFARQTNNVYVHRIEDYGIWMGCCSVFIYRAYLWIRLCDFLL